MFLKSLTVLLFALVVGRLFQLQVIQHSKYIKEAEAQYNSKIKLPAKRGEILINNYKTGQVFPLATDTSLDLLYIDPVSVTDEERVATKISEITGLDRNDILNKALEKERTSVVLATEVHEDLLKEIEEKNYRGIHVTYNLPELVEEEYDPGEDVIEISDDNKEPVYVRTGTVYADPTTITDHQLVASHLSTIIDVSVEDLVKSFKRRSIRYVPLKRKLFPEISEEVRSLDLDGVVLIPEHWRYYPEGKLASNLLGFVNKEGVGQYGIEGQFDKQLHGVDGKLLVDRDPYGREIAVGNKELVQAIDGDNFVLTIDRIIQQHVEKVLAETVEEFEAYSGEIIVMDPKTGRILAMSSYPDYNPNEFWKVYEKDEESEEYLNRVGPQAYYNPAVALPYEPGSVFKAVTMAAALDANEIEPETKYEDTGKLEVDKFVIRNSDNLAHGWQTMTYVLEQSLNTGAYYAAKQMGPTLFHSYIKSFGFGQRTGIRLDTENGGTFSPLNKWGKTAFVTSSFGQGFTATPIQVVSAISALVNGGTYMRPYIIERIYNDSTGLDKRFEPKIEKQVITEDAANKVKGMLVSVVEEGFGYKAEIPGFYVGGKTGTSQVPEEDGSGYSKEKFIASFAGFAPAEDPAFVILVKINYPKLKRYGSTVAAPAFQRIAEMILKYYGIKPTRTP